MQDLRKHWPAVLWFLGVYRGRGPGFIITHPVLFRSFSFRAPQVHQNTRITLELGHSSSTGSIIINLHGHFTHGFSEFPCRVQNCFAVRVQCTGVGTGEEDAFHAGMRATGSLSLLPSELVIVS